VFPHLGSTDIPFSSYHLKGKYVQLMGKDKGWSKKSFQTFSNDFGKGFENGMMEGRKWTHVKRF
jgi:hypothetical protein